MKSLLPACTKKWKEMRVLDVMENAWWGLVNQSISEPICFSHVPLYCIAWHKIVFLCTYFFIISFLLTYYKDIQYIILITVSITHYLCIFALWFFGKCVWFGIVFTAISFLLFLNLFSFLMNIFSSFVTMMNT